MVADGCSPASSTGSSQRNYQQTTSEHTLKWYTDLLEGAKHAGVPPDFGQPPRRAFRAGLGGTQQWPGQRTTIELFSKPPTSTN